MTTPTPARLLLLGGLILLLGLQAWLGWVHPLSSGIAIALIATAFVAATVGMQRGSLSAPLLLGSAVSGLALAALTAWLGWNSWLAALLPAICQAALAWLVWRTLRPGSNPAIQRMAEAILAHPLHEPMIAYARRSTTLWVWVFALLAVVNALVALTRQPSPPLALGLLDALVAAAVVLGEFFYRRWRYPQHNRLTLREFWRGLRRVDPLAVLR